MSKKSFINENRLFSKIKDFFAAPGAVFGEIAQNAMRAKATMLDITFKDGVLTAVDDGCGCDDPATLLVLSDSGWDPETEINQNPAGWGLYHLIAISSTITVKSTFGAITIDCQEFLGDSEYRQHLLNRVSAKAAIKGFSVSATILPEARRNMSGYDFEWYPMDVTFNGKKIVQKMLPTKSSDMYLITEYQGNRVKINLGARINDVSCIWYGHVVGARSYNRPEIFIDVRQGSPLTPVLPYRTQLKEDAKLEAFLQFCHESIAAYAIKLFMQKIAKFGDKLAVQDVEGLIPTIARYAPQGALDNLPCWVVSEKQPNVQGSNLLVVRKGDRIVTDDIKVVIDGVEADDEYSCSYYDELGTIYSAGTAKIVSATPHAGNAPAWAKPVEVPVTIEVTIEARENFEDIGWRKSKIVASDGREITMIVRSDDDNYGLDIFYSGKPEEFMSLSHDAFAAFIYYDDGDQYETQKYEFSERVSRSLAAVNRSVNLYDALSVFRTLPGFPKVENLKAIEFGKGFVRVVPKKGEPIKYAA